MCQRVDPSPIKGHPAKPWKGATVHYVEPNGIDQPAIVTAIASSGMAVWMTVVPHQEMPYFASANYCENNSLGSWHWPEKV